MRFSVYAPFSTEFNNVEQTRKRFNWGIDYFAGMEFKASVKGYVNVHIAPGLHFLYEYTDRFSYIDLGIGGYINAELPVSYHWSIVLDGIGSFDFGNLGSNKLFEYYNIDTNDLNEKDLNKIISTLKIDETNFGTPYLVAVKDG